MESKEKDVKVKVEDYLDEYRINDQKAFSKYLKDIFNDLNSRQGRFKSDTDEAKDEKAKGIPKTIMDRYYQLPGIIGDRLFKVLDKNNDQALDLSEFTDGFITLFCSDFDKTSKFIFDFYDFDQDGIIRSEDIRVILSYITLSGKATKINYNSRVNSQEELFNILQKCFENISNGKMDYNCFKYVVENVNSDIYLMILLFIMDNKPFTNENVAPYASNDKGDTKPNVKFAVPNPSNKEKKIASPSKKTAFSPYKSFQRNVNKRKTTVTKRAQVKDNLLLNQAPEPEFKRKAGKRKTVQEGCVKLKKFDFDLELEDEKKSKKKIDQKRLKDLAKNSKHGPQYDVENEPNTESFQPAFRQTNDPKFIKLQQEIKALKEGKKGFQNDDDYQINFDSDSEDELDSEDDKREDLDEPNQEEEINRYEGLLYKYVDNKMRKLWFKLVHRDLYYYKNKDEKKHKGMHNLSGLFLQEEEPKIVDGKKYYSFSVVYPSKKRNYYCNDESQFKTWLEKLKKATGYTNLTDIYEVKQKLGNGKFGLVKMGINKKTGQQVAIKIMHKKNMDSSDLELVRTEIEILKICQHPNIIRLYDVFENPDFIYIIMEFCSGGDLFGYLEERNFKISEEKAVVIMHKMCAAVFYIHSYGIAHRDLKPENILMTDNTDDGDIRILDFGLSKIIGPNEKCTEPYGTLTYCAPEIIVDEPYNKAVDLWSLGVMTYLMLSGQLPFNSTDETEIARLVAFEEPDFTKNPAWKKVSREAKSFIKGLLQKEPKKRMNIKQALEHDWFKKYNKGINDDQVSNEQKKGEKAFKLYSSVDK